jgi:hypothetical protein
VCIAHRDAISISRGYQILLNLSVPGFLYGTESCCIMKDAGKIRFKANGKRLINT